MTNVDKKECECPCHIKSPRLCSYCSESRCHSTNREEKDFDWEKEFEEKFVYSKNDGYPDVLSGDSCSHPYKIKSFIHKIASQERLRGAEEERKDTKAFLKNVLDGIDEGDRQMGNVGGGTKAIRLALLSRGLLKSPRITPFLDSKEK